jgi:hypothetical protein
VRVHGVSPGSTDVSVESALGADTVAVSVTEVDVATVEHWLVGMLPKMRFSTDAAFLRGGTGRFFLAMRDASGRRAVGAGIVPPITVEPERAAAIAAIADGDLRHVEVRFDRAGPVELRMRRTAPLKVLVVEAASVTALEIVALDLQAGAVESPSSVGQGRGLGAAVRGVLQDGSRVLLLGDVARIASATPDVCATPADLTERARLVFGDGATAVDAVSPGTCTLVATLGALRGEVSMTVEARAETAETPGAGGA